MIWIVNKGSLYLSSTNNRYLWRICNYMQLQHWTWAERQLYSLLFVLLQLFFLSDPISRIQCGERLHKIWPWMRIFPRWTSEACHNTFAWSRTSSNTLQWRVENIRWRRMLLVWRQAAPLMTSATSFIQYLCKILVQLQHLHAITQPIFGRQISPGCGWPFPGSNFVQYKKKVKR